MKVHEEIYVCGGEAQRKTKVKEKNRYHYIRNPNQPSAKQVGGETALRRREMTTFEAGQSHRKRGIRRKKEYD